MAVTTSYRFFFAQRVIEPVEKGMMMHCMTEQTLSMKWKLMKHNKSVDKTQTVQPSYFTISTP